MCAKPHVSPLMTPSLTLPNQPLSLAPPTPPLMSATPHQPPAWSSGAPLMLSPLPSRTKKTMSRPLDDLLIVSQHHCPFTCVNQTSTQQKQASEEQDVLFQAQIPCNIYQETFPQHWNEIW